MKLVISTVTLSVLSALLAAIETTEKQELTAGTVSSSSYKDSCCQNYPHGNVLVKSTTAGSETVKMYFCPENLKFFCHDSVPSYISCRDILERNVNAISGDYNITSPADNSTVEVYCDMKGLNCDNEGGWTRIAHLNMAEPGATCPIGLQATNYSNIGHQLCSKGGNNGAGCSSAYYNTPALLTNYTKVCGRVKGYQFGSPDGLAPHLGLGYQPDLTIDDKYVDGISITRGDTTRQHVWTYVAGGQEIRSGKHDCPCNREFNVTLYTPPSFVGTDYYCESGKSNSTNLKVLYGDDPLWDGKLCRDKEDTCCASNMMPWFIKDLNNKDNGPIEVRICSTSQDEDTPIEVAELYIK